MSNAIGPIISPNPVDTVSLSSLAGGKKQVSGSSGADSFKDILEQSVARVEQFQRDTQEKTTSLLNGEDRDLHEVALAAQRSELSFDYFMQVRNKVVQAYQEVMRMQM